MRRVETNKEAKTMTVKKMMTAIIATLLILVPMQGLNVTAANANGITTTLDTFTIDGSDVEDGDIMVVASGTTAVTVVAIPTDPAATAAVTGDTGLVTGDNDVVVKVTSSNTLDQQTYTVNVFVTEQSNIFSTDATLSALTANGVSVIDGQTVEVAPLTTAVTVLSTTSHVNATTVVSGSLNLVSGVNNVSVTVTAEDGTTIRVYSFKVRVLSLPTDVALASFTVNGQSVRNGGRIFLEPGTEAVTVVATPSDSTSSVVVTGRTGLTAGPNTLSVLVTSQAGTSATYEVTLNVQIPSNNSSLVVFKVSGARVTDGTTVFIPAGTTAVAVTALASDSAASVAVTGSNGLQLGENTLTVVVTAEDGTTTTSTVTLNVLASDDTSLALFQYDGSDVSNGEEFDLDNGVTSVEITAEATSSLSTVAIVGADTLVSGRNVVKISVTAQDTSVSTYLLIFNVAQSDDTSLASLTVGGEDAIGGSVTLPAGTRAAAVVAVTTDPFASYVVEGNAELIPGENTVTVTVTAADGEASDVVEVTVTVTEVVLSDDTSLASLTVGGEDAIGGSVTLPAGTRAAAVLAETTDPFASYVVEGNAELIPGENTVTVTVTAADGEASDVVEVTVTVTEVVLSDDTSLASLTVGGEDAIGGAVTLPAGTRAAVVVAVTTDPFASFVVEGNAELIPGENTVTVTVTAADGEASDAVEITVTVEEVILSDDTSLEVFLVNGIDGTTNDAIELPYGVTRVNVLVTTTDATASYIVTGDGRLSPLVEGENELVLTVTAANGDSEEYIITLTVLPISTNNNIDPDAGLFVNGESVDLELLDNPTGFVNLPLTDTSVSIQVKAESDTSDVIANGKTMLSTVARTFGLEKGVNEINIQVIPQAGLESEKTYKLKVYVGGADTTLKTVKVNTTTLTVEDGTAALQTPLANGTTTATIYVEPTVAVAVGLVNGTKLEFDGGEATVTKAAAANTWNVTGLVTGENVIALTVTPGDEAAEAGSYSIVIPVALSPDKRLNTFTVNGALVTVGSVIALAKGATSAEIDGSTVSDVATYEVSGGDSLVVGKNILTITVTAEDETSQEYKVTAIVPKQIDIIVIPFPKVGVLTVDKKTNVKGNAAITAGLKKIKGTVGIVKITNNFLIAKDKVTAGPARATNTKKYLAALKTNGFKTAVYQLVPDPKAKTAKGTTVTIYSY